MLEKEFEYYLRNQTELVKQYSGKHLVIKDEKVQGAFDTLDEAYLFATENFDLGTFLLQKCTPGDDSYSQTFHSRAVFA